MGDSKRIWNLDGTRNSYHSATGSFDRENESFKFGKQLKVCIASYRGDSVTLVFDSFKDDFQKATGIKVTSVRSEAKAGIVLSVNQTLAPEAYKLDVSPKQIRIEAARPAGFYYALQTLKQLISRHVMAGVAVGGRQEWSIPTVEIEDVPRFEWRALCWTRAGTFSEKMR